LQLVLEWQAVNDYLNNTVSFIYFAG
jgi:hypothetical protein